MDVLASIYCELVRQVLRHAVNGHAVIGTLRLFGFKVFRNTYKPLLAESRVAFWGRYYYFPWSRTFYCFLLAIGIFVSMGLEKRRAGGKVPAGWGGAC